MRAYVSCLLFALVTALLIPISASAQSTDVDCVAIVDSDGSRVGRLMGDNVDFVSFYEEHNGIAVPLYIQGQALTGLEDNIYFADASCSSEPFLYDRPLDLTVVSGVMGQDVFYNFPSTGLQNLQYNSRFDTISETCIATSDSSELLPAVYNFTIPQYITPFHLEPEACYTPPSAVAALTPFSLAAMALVLGFGAYLMVRPGAHFARK